MTTGALRLAAITAPVSTAHREMPIRAARIARTCARPPRSGCRFDQALLDTLLDTSAAVDNEARRGERDGRRAAIGQHHDGGSWTCATTTVPPASWSPGAHFDTAPRAARIPRLAWRLGHGRHRERSGLQPLRCSRRGSSPSRGTGLLVVLPDAPISPEPAGPGSGCRSAHRQFVSLTPAQFGVPAHFHLVRPVLEQTLRTPHGRFAVRMSRFPCPSRCLSRCRRSRAFPLPSRTRSRLAV